MPHLKPIILLLLLTLNLTANTIDSKEEIIKDKLGRSSIFVYDAMDNILTETNVEKETTSYRYDDADRLVETTYPDGTTTSTTYDKAGRTLGTTDQNSNTTTYEYDAVGNQIKVIDALGNETIFSYDAQGNRISGAKGSSKGVGVCQEGVTTSVN